MSLDDSSNSLSRLIDLVSRHVADEEGNSPGLINVFVAFQLFGLFGLLIVLVTVMCSHSTPRHAAWYSFAISWMISTISYTLLFWGGYLSIPMKDPPFALCLIQGILVYSSPPLTAFTTLALVVQMWYLVRSVVVTPIQSNRVGGRPSPMILTILLILPYLLFVGILVATLILGLRDPGTVRRVTTSGMYCSFSNRVPGRISTLLCAVIMIPAAVFEVLICRALRKQWAVFEKHPYGRTMAIRVVVFTFVGLLAIALSLLFFFTVHHGAALNVVISSLPVSAVLIFGTQNDVVRAWMFWKKRPTETTSASETKGGVSTQPAAIDIKV